MKKLISLTLALLLVFSLATVASAQAVPSVMPNEEVKTDANVPSTFYFKKAYNDGNTAADTFPAEILKFKVADSTDEDAPTLTVADHSVDDNPDVVSVTVGEATVPGVYTYTITEETGTTQGVTYSSDPIKVTVWVYYEDVTSAEGTASRVLKKSVTFTKEGTADKVDTITNTYTLHNLAIKKVVTGSLGEQDPNKQKFDITVTFVPETGKTVNSSISWSVAGTTQNDITPDMINKEGGYTATFTLGHDQTVSFTNIPDGVKYTILEDDKHTLELGETFDPNDTSSGYTAIYTTDQQTMNADSDQTITNNKDQDVETGITLDSIPFILILAVCAGAVVLFVVKRRRSVDF